MMEGEERRKGRQGERMVEKVKDKKRKGERRGKDIYKLRVKKGHIKVRG